MGRQGAREDEEDDQKTYKDRKWDDWKDHHPWGEGNKMASVEEGELQDSNSSSEEEDNESKQAPSVLKFKNDGSFLEMFKKMQEQNKDSKESNVPKEAEKVSVKSEPSDNSSNISEIKKEEVSQKKPGLLSMVR